MGVALAFSNDRKPLIKKFNVKCVPALIILTGDG